MQWLRRWFSGVSGGRIHNKLVYDRPSQWKPTGLTDSETNKSNQKVQTAPHQKHKGQTTT